jgi:hypothetical protein
MLGEKLACRSIQTFAIVSVYDIGILRHGGNLVRTMRVKPDGFYRKVAIMYVSLKLRFHVRCDTLLNQMSQ